MKAYFNPKQMGEGKEETREVFGSLFNSVPPNGSYAAGDTATFGSKGEANASIGQCKSKVGQVPEGRFWNWLSDQYVLNCFSSPCDPVKITECHCLRHQNSFFFYLCSHLSSGKRPVNLESPVSPWRCRKEFKARCMNRDCFRKLPVISSNPEIWTSGVRSPELNWFAKPQENKLSKSEGTDWQQISKMCVWEHENYTTEDLALINVKSYVKSWLLLGSCSVPWLRTLQCDYYSCQKGWQLAMGSWKSNSVSSNFRQCEITHLRASPMAGACGELPRLPLLARSALTFKGSVSSKAKRGDLASPCLGCAIYTSSLCVNSNKVFSCLLWTLTFPRDHFFSSLLILPSVLGTFAQIKQFFQRMLLGFPFLLLSFVTALCLQVPECLTAKGYAAPLFCTWCAS